MSNGMIEVLWTLTNQLGNTLYCIIYKPKYMKQNKCKQGKGHIIYTGRKEITLAGLDPL